MICRTILGEQERRMQYVEVYEFFKEGKAAMTYTWNSGSILGFINDPANLDVFGGVRPSSWSISFLDSSPENKGLMSVHCFGMSKDSKNKEAAAKFLSYYLDDEFKKVVSERNGLVHSNGRIAVTEWLAEKGMNVSALPDAINDVGFFWPISQKAWPETELVRDICRENIEKLLGGTITPEEFVQITGDGIEQLMSEAGYF